MARKDRSSSRRPEGRAGKATAAEAAPRRPPRGRGPRPRRRPAPTANVYGRNAVREALRGQAAGAARSGPPSAAAKEGFSGAPITVVDADEITRRCGSDAHQGVCAEAEPYPYADAAELLAAPDPFLVALDEVTDPQNLGAVIRTAECAGATGVVIPERRSAEVTAAVAKASAGAVEHLPVARVRNLADFLARRQGGRLLDATGRRPARARPYDAPDYAGGVVLVLGAEGRACGRASRAPCDELVSLPMRGRIDSLNVSAAGAVLMYAILQKRLDTST